jgi:hypothetical protein
MMCNIPSNVKYFFLSWMLNISCVCICLSVLSFILFSSFCFMLLSNFLSLSWTCHIVIHLLMLYIYCYDLCKWYISSWLRFLLIYSLCFVASMPLQGGVHACGYGCTHILVHAHVEYLFSKAPYFLRYAVLQLTVIGLIRFAPCFPYMLQLAIFVRCSWFLAYVVELVLLLCYIGSVFMLLHIWEIWLWCDFKVVLPYL